MRMNLQDEPVRGEHTTKNSGYADLFSPNATENLGRYCMGRRYADHLLSTVFAHAEMRRHSLCRNFSYEMLTHFCFDIGQ